MSDVVPHKKSIGKERLRTFYVEPLHFKFLPYEPTEISFSDGEIASATCLGCQDTPCIELPLSDLSLNGTLASFPGDPSRDVCPKNAISWDLISQSPRVADDDCIGCGLCALFCPYGAISINRLTGKAVVESTDPSKVTVESSKGINNSLPMYKRTGSLVDINHSFFKILPDVKFFLTDIQSSRLVRNMLISYNMKASVRRKGDTNVRMDGIINLWDRKVGILEIELSASVLDSPRALLEDIAVVHSRYNIPIEKILPVSIILTYPNKRAEYYQVIKDIEAVLGISINTLSLGLLCMAVLISKFKNKLLHTSTKDSYYSLSRSLTLSLPSDQRKEPYPGALKALK